jgi:hypothetical protein
MDWVGLEMAARSFANKRRSRTLRSRPRTFSSWARQVAGFFGIESVWDAKVETMLLGEKTICFCGMRALTFLPPRT